MALMLFPSLYRPMRLVQLVPVVELRVAPDLCESMWAALKKLLTEPTLGGSPAPSIPLGRTLSAYAVSGAAAPATSLSLFWSGA